MNIYIYMNLSLYIYIYIYACPSSVLRPAMSHEVPPNAVL